MSDTGENQDTKETNVESENSTTNKLDNTIVEGESEASSALKTEDKSLNEGEKGNDSLSNPGSITTTPNLDTNSAASNKIEILLKAVGNAPILKKKKFLLERTKNVQFIIEWLRKYMKLDSKEQLFLYVNQEFAPSPDAEIGTIYDCFKIGNNVIFHYCTTPAWG